MQRIMNNISWWLLAILVVPGQVLLSGSAGASVGTLADSSGQVVAWGWNDAGQTIVPSGNIATIAAGSNFNLGIQSDGTLVGWGFNGSGQTTVPAGTFTAVAAGGNHGLGIRDDGTLAGWGDNGYGQATVPAGMVFTAISAGNAHSLGVRHDGTLTGWGYNGYGQTTVPAGTFSAVAAGDYHSLGIQADGTLAGWGYNGSGQTTVPAGTFTAIAAGHFHSLGIRDDGTLAGWGYNYYGQTNVPLGTFSAVAAGYVHSLGIRADGTLAGWGDNYYGQTTVPAGAFTAVAAGAYHSLGLRARTDYDDDLLVSYTGDPYGPNGLKANLNRSITVAGDARIESWVYLYNNPTLTVGGKLVLEPGGWLAVVDAGTIVTQGGIEVRPGAYLFIPTNLTLVSAGPLMGGGYVDVDGNLSVGLSNGSSFTGDLWLRDNAVLDFSGTGVITPNRLDARYNAEVRLTAGQQLQAGWIENFGKIEALGNPNVLGGIAEVECRDGGFNANGTGLITGHDAVFRFGQAASYMFNDGSIALTGGVNDVFGDIQNTVIGAVVVTGGSQATFYDDMLNNGQIVVRKLGGVASTATFLGSYSGSGSTSGGGDILFEGDLKPGNSPAAIGMANNVGLGPGARLEIELGGTTPGSQFDQLLVTGELGLGGTLDVELIDLGGGVFQPQLGDMFEVASATAGISGSFSAQQLPDLGALLDMRVVQLANDLLLAVVPALAGDYNANGTVDAADYTVWCDTFRGVNIFPLSLAADGDADNDVDDSDYALWRANFGMTTPGSGAYVAESLRDSELAVSEKLPYAAVPEPATAWLFLIGGGLLWIARRGGS